MKKLFFYNQKLIKLVLKINQIILHINAISFFFKCLNIHICYYLISVLWLIVNATCNMDVGRSNIFLKYGTR